MQFRVGLQIPHMSFFCHFVLLAEPIIVARSSLGSQVVCLSNVHPSCGTSVVCVFVKLDSP